MMRSCFRDWNVPGTNHAAKCIEEHLDGRLGQGRGEATPEDRVALFLVYKRVGQVQAKSTLPLPGMARQDSSLDGLK
ncbi:hypothetical protein DXT91_11565 [Agrobacterium tumefaciens]|nr:hypothetical protein [Agrobacterium tumefaciens]